MIDSPSCTSNELVMDALQQALALEGKITFHEFMAIALYSQGGYYQNPNPVFGAQGDFITAPELTPLFGQTIATQCLEIIAKIDGPITIMELGPGSGVLAKDILTFLQNHGVTIEQYLLIETSPSLTHRQQKNLKDFDQCQWATHIPKDQFNGIILANELFDALPVHKVQLDKETHKEWYVTLKDEQLTLSLDKISSPKLQVAIETTLDSLDQDMPFPYDTEFNLDQEKIIQQCTSSLQKGVMLFIDYGFGENDFYNPSRYMGTLMGHTKHKANCDPLDNPGLQDITAHVDFTAITRAAVKAGAELLGFTTQATFLVSLNILSNSPLNYKQSQALRTLIEPQEMGEIFKVLALGKNFNHDLKGFHLRDHAYLL